MSPKTKFQFLGLVVGLCSFSSICAFGQSTGAIQGTVTDASGAVVANATVRVTDPAHGVDRTQATDSAGLYYVPSLPVGTYNVEVRAPGLATTETKGVILNVGTTVTQDFNLSV